MCSSDLLYLCPSLHLPPRSHPTPAVTVYQGELPPLLLFFQALMISAHAGTQLPDQSLSVEGVCCALENNFVELVTHWVTQNRYQQHTEWIVEVQKECACCLRVLIVISETLKKSMTGSAVLF